MGAVAGAVDEQDDVSAVHERTDGMVAYAGVCSASGGADACDASGVAPEAAPDDAWQLEDVGASRCDETGYMCVSGPAHVRVTWIVDGRTVMRLVPSAVLAHVLRVQREAG
jgi:hypothetical protein